MKKRLIFGLITLLATLVLLEAASRILGHVEWPPDPLIAEQNEKWGHSREYDPLLFWRLKPRTGDENKAVNAYGLRGPEIEDKAPDEFRILSLGESTTYGWKIDFRDCYSSLLETRLREQRQARVINAGMPGYTTFQGRVFLEHRGMQLDPDVVVLYFGFNDYLNVAFRDRRDPLSDTASMGMTDRQLFESRQRLSVVASNQLFRYSNFLRWMGSVIHTRGDNARAAGSGGSDGQTRIDNALRRVPDADRRESLEQSVKLVREHGAELLIVIPWYRDFESHATLLREFAVEFDVTLVDLPRALEDHSDRRSELFLDPSHPGVEGHQLIADEIWSVVEASWTAPD